MLQKIYHLVKEPKVIAEKNPLLVLIHGYGSNEEDLFSFATELPDDCYIVSLRAPYALQPYGYAWYAIHFDENMNKFSDDQQAIESRELIASFIKEFSDKYPIDKEKVSLVGFSQGAILSYSISITYPELIYKTVALSGYFNPALIENNGKDLSGLHIFVSHGTQDQVIPIEWARKTPAILDDLGITYEYHEYPAGHGVNPKNFFDFKDFLLK